MTHWCSKYESTFRSNFARNLRGLVNNVQDSTVMFWEFKFKSSGFINFQAAWTPVYGLNSSTIFFSKRKDWLNKKIRIVFHHHLLLSLSLSLSLSHTHTHAHTLSAFFGVCLFLYNSVSCFLFYFMTMFEFKKLKHRWNKIELTFKKIILFFQFWITGRATKCKATWIFCQKISIKALLDFEISS